jgi:hypothetical protein
MRSMNTLKRAISITLPESSHFKKLLNMRGKLRRYTGKKSLTVSKSALKNTKMSLFVGPQGLARL